jgi:hypothetical protein
MQYPFNGLHQNGGSHGVYKIPQLKVLQDSGNFMDMNNTHPIAYAKMVVFMLFSKHPMWVLISP